MTVAATHRIHAPGLIKSVENLGCTGDVCLYFPLPADRFYNFNKQHYKWPRAPRQEKKSAKQSREAAQEKGEKNLERVRQFALLIDCSALELSGAEDLGAQAEKAAAGGSMPHYSAAGCSGKQRGRNRHLTACD